MAPALTSVPAVTTHGDRGRWSVRPPPPDAQERSLGGLDPGSIPIAAVRVLRSEPAEHTIGARLLDKPQSVVLSSWPRSAGGQERNSNARCQPRSYAGGAAIPRPLRFPG